MNTRRAWRKEIHSAMDDALNAGRPIDEMADEDREEIDGIVSRMSRGHASRKHTGYDRRTLNDGMFIRCEGYKFPVQTRKTHEIASLTNNVNEAAVLLAISAWNGSAFSLYRGTREKMAATIGISLKTRDTAIKSLMASGVLTRHETACLAVIGDTRRNVKRYYYKPTSFINSKFIPRWFMYDSMFWPKQYKLTAASFCVLMLCLERYPVVQNVDLTASSAIARFLRITRQGVNKIKRELINNRIIEVNPNRSYEKNDVAYRLTTAMCSPIIKIVRERKTRFAQELAIHAEFEEYHKMSADTTAQDIFEMMQDQGNEISAQTLEDIAAIRHANEYTNNVHNMKNALEMAAKEPTRKPSKIPNAPPPPKRSQPKIENKAQSRYDELLNSLGYNKTILD